MTKTEVVAELLTLGATREKREDAHGDTKTGWWLDGVYLAPLSDPRSALDAVRGR